MSTDDLEELIHEYISTRRDMSYNEMQSRLHDIVENCIDHFEWEIKE